jgi:hypothetical protein
MGANFQGSIDIRTTLDGLPCEICERQVIPFKTQISTIEGSCGQHMTWFVASVFSGAFTIVASAFLSLSRYYLGQVRRQAGPYVLRFKVVLINISLVRD